MNGKRLFIVAFSIFLILSAMVPVLASNYIGNRNTHRFHYPNCSSVSEMNPDNQVGINSREEAIANGYVPCKRCKP